MRNSMAFSNTIRDLREAEALDISEGKICKDLKVELNKVIRNCRDEGFSWDEIGYRLIQVIGDALYDAEINEGFDEDEEE